MAATHFDRVRGYARSKGVKVLRAGRSACLVRAERTIYVPKVLRGRDALWTLLHEMGHVLVDDAGTHDRDMYVDVDAPSWAGRAFCVTEEWDAWGRGKKLAAQLGIHVDANAYDNYAAAYIAGYIHTAATAPF